MNNRVSIPVSAEAEAITPTCGFVCPNCVMGGAVCGDCSQFTSDSRCGLDDEPRARTQWACSWYYTH